MRFKNNEKYSNITCNPPLVVRLDGVNFSSFTKNEFENPFSPIFHDIFTQIGEELMDKFNFIKKCYIQSDEINLIIPKHIDYNGRIEKINSILSRKASSIFNTEYYKIKEKNIYKCFDSRIVEFEDYDKIQEYIDTKVNNCYTNCINSLCHHYLKGKYSKKNLMGKGRNERIKLLEEEGININEDIEKWKKYGTIIKKIPIEKEVINKKTKEKVKVKRKELKYSHPNFKK